MFGDALEPTEVSRLLRCEPDESYRAGDRISSRSGGVRKNGSWSINDHLSPTDSLSTKLEDVLSRVTVDSDIRRALTGQVEASLFCGIFLNNPEKLGELVSLPATLLKRAADLGLELVLDIWPPPATGER
ncbi:MAG: DUF4279 domain-containing protein [Chloroflexi bacterium]|nr:DUF4279 domain-containing protein [Chloroflexota bacterium]